MTTDYVLMNPPYDGSLHLKILGTIIRLGVSQCVNLSPIRWLQDPLAPYKNGHDFETFINVRKHLPTLDIIDVKDAQVIFNARIPIDLGIYNITKKECVPFTLHTDLINRLTKFNSENPCPLDFNKKDGWRVRMPNVTCSSAANTGIKETTLKTLLCFDGLHNGRPWYSFFSKNQNTKETPEITCSISFHTETEANNFIKSLTLDLIRYYTQKTVISVDYIKNLQVFWLGDTVNPRTGRQGYLSDWTEQDLESLFCVNEHELAEIKDTLAPFAG